VVQIVMLMNAAGPIRAGNNPGWFLNSGDNVAIVALTLAAGAAALALSASDVILRAAMFAAGAINAMAATLFLIGPGNIFPIVIAIGGVIVILAVGCGTAVGSIVRYVIRIGHASTD
jgi:hypothetical protein